MGSVDNVMDKLAKKDWRRNRKTRPGAIAQSSDVHAQAMPRTGSGSPGHSSAPFCFLRSGGISGEILGYSAAIPSTDPKESRNPLLWRYRGFPAAITAPITPRAVGIS